jgi:hypothetical protein
MLRLIVVIFPVAQLFANMRTKRTEIAARRYQSERVVVYIVPCIRHVYYYPHRKPLEDCLLCGPSVGHRTEQSSFLGVSS